MAQIAKKVRVASNPHRKPAKSSRPHAVPKKGTKHMAKNGTKKAAKRKASKNPLMTMRKKRRKNPSGLSGIVGSPKDLVEMGVAGLASAVATRQLPQLLFSTENTGILGYSMNAITAAIVTWGAGAFIGPKAAQGALVGGLVILLDRILTEQVSPIGQYLALSGVGDATAMTKLGTIGDGFYLHPTVLDGNGNPIIPQQVSDAAINAMLQRYPQIAAAPSATRGAMGAVNPSAMRRHSANGMLLSSRFQGRFNQ
jgi:hypothetical protein